jgi:hypothetical protein
MTIYCRTKRRTITTARKKCIITKKRECVRTGFCFSNLIDLHDQLRMYQDFLHLKSKENALDDEFHGKIPLDLIELNHISCWNHDEHP